MYPAVGLNLTDTAACPQAAFKRKQIFVYHFFKYTGNDLSDKPSYSMLLSVI